MEMTTTLMLTLTGSVMGRNNRIETNFPKHLVLQQHSGANLQIDREITFRRNSVKRVTATARGRSIIPKLNMKYMDSRTLTCWLSL